IIALAAAAIFTSCDKANDAATDTKDNSGTTPTSDIAAIRKAATAEVAEAVERAAVERAAAKRAAAEKAAAAKGANK
ncbi:MAG: hypothetical protein P8P36_04525, partial [Akkermansiaceae bacterium]|nr:hypothetical protein [Akkermansiaceae bacterium]